ncbi:DUF2306 domain-containing protein [Paenibacillus glycanilyticus]|uniref:DUF2306 domain-containing protein n=1 Tax=Paenibacillus glycanilyticus TaxID=126569 RepID=A0ABQ6GHX6_9BACL|nr:DUF2306 domain-containing protein [Paenibacillus glycanilyticus]GLX69848.1 hypothetical protein MU1_41940 [Paenibacillus glycanilyticus]
MKKSWWILLLLSIAIMLPFVIPYLTFNPAGSRIEISSRTLQYPALVGHILLAMLAMLAGFLQFHRGIRQKNPALHARLGKTYVYAVFLSGGLALIVASYEPDFGRTLSFLFLDALWLITTAMGFRSAMKRDWKAHKQWMIRSFAMTLTAVSARALVPFLFLLYLLLHRFALPEGRMEMIEEVLNNNIWAAIVVNFILVEWFILRPRREQPLL